MILIISFFFDLRTITFVSDKYSCMKNFLSYFWSKIRTKYGIALSIFLLWILFFDENSIVQHFQNKHKLVQLIEQEHHLRYKITSDKRKIKELQTNQKNLEKFAREEFLMKKKNEDVYLIQEEN